MCQKRDELRIRILRIAIPLSGNVLGEVPIDCFPRTDDLDKPKVTKWVSFATEGQISTVPVEPPIAEPEEPSTEEPTGRISQEIDGPRVKDFREVSPVPPPGFRPFDVFPTSSRTIVTDPDRELSGFNHGASRYYGFRSLYPYCARPDPFSASASVTPTDEDTFHI